MPTIGGQKLTKIILISLLILFTLMLSETIYILNNRPSIFSVLYIHASKYYATKGNYSSVILSLSNAARLGIKDQSQAYPEFIPHGFAPNIYSQDADENLKQAIVSYVKLMEIPSTKDTDILVYTSKIYYFLAIISYKSNDYDKAERYLQTSVYLTPENSPSHVELANLYLTLGEKEKAREAIYFCLNFRFPKNPCEYYIKNNLEEGVAEPVGFKQEDVQKTYN